MTLMTFVWLVVGLVFLVFGAEWLVRGASSLAARLGVAPIIIGLTVVASARALRRWRSPSAAHFQAVLT